MREFMLNNKRRRLWFASGRLECLDFHWAEAWIYIISDESNLLGSIPGKGPLGPMWTLPCIVSEITGIQ